MHTIGYVFFRAVPKGEIVRSNRVFALRYSFSLKKQHTDLVAVFILKENVFNYKRIDIYNQVVYTFNNS